MFLRAKTRIKDGKPHCYWSIVENRRVRRGRVIQRQVLYLGEINDAQRQAWCRSIEVLEEASDRSRQMAIFPDDRAVPAMECDVVQVRLNELSIKRPRQWGACWMACEVWEWLKLDEFWSPRLPMSREGTHWLHVFKLLVCYRLIEPGSEWRCHRLWYDTSAMWGFTWRGSRDCSGGHLIPLFR